MKKKHKYLTALSLICAVCTAPVLAARTPYEKPLSGTAFTVPESAFCRKELVETWFTENPETLKMREPQIVQNETDDYFLVRAEEANGELQITVAPLVKQKVIVHTNELPPPVAVIDRRNEQKNTEDASSSPVSETWVETWPQNTPGSWILYRDAATGKHLRIRMYFVPDSAVYIEFFPGKEKVFADFVIFGALCAGRVPLPVTFERLYTMPFEEIRQLSRHTLPWKFSSVFSHSYEDIIQMIGLIRSLLPDLKTSSRFKGSTASVDFLKWIVDGLVKPLSGGIVREDVLKVNTVDSPDNSNMKLHGSATQRPASDFGSLNYIRNMAAAAISARTGVTYTYNTSGADVKTEVFSYYTDFEGRRHTAGFSANSGYPVEMLKPLLYVLGVTEAHRFFLGAVRQDAAKISSAEQSAGRYVFTEAAAFFPWFDSQGRFQVSVFEQTQEYTLDQFIEKYRGDFIALVRLKASMDFYPDRPGSEPAGSAALRE